MNSSLHLLNRRNFIRAAAGVALSLPLSLHAQQASATRRLPTRPIPVSGEPLPIIGLGSHASFQSLPATGKEGPVSVIRILLDHGGSFIDTTIWPDEGDPVLGQLIEEMGTRQDLFISGKVVAKSRDAGTRQLQDNERVFGKRPMDLIQVWNMQSVDVLWPLLREWKDNGKIRYIGVTNSRRDNHELMETFMRREKPDFIQINYSALEPAAAERLLPLARDLGIAVGINRPFLNGRYFQIVKDRPLPDWAAEFDCHSWAQFSLKFILANPAVNCVITETDKPRHITDNLGAGFGRLPDAKTQQRMMALLRS